MRILVICFLTSLLLSSIFSCSNDTQYRNYNDCKCPLEAIPTITRAYSEEEKSSTYGTGGDVNVEIPFFKRLLNIDVGIDGNLEGSNKTVNEIFSEILADDPKLNQDYNIKAGIVCAKYNDFICNNTLLSQVEKQQRKEQLLNEFNEFVDRLILDSNGVITSVSSKNSIGNNNSSLPVRIPTKNDQSTVNYFSNKQVSDIAIVSLGNKDHKDFGQSLSSWLRGNGYSLNQSLFNSSFFNKFGRQVTNNASIYKEINSGRYTNCVCVFDQAIKLQEETLVGEEIITAIFSGKITLFNLKDGNQESRDINVRGAGVIVSRVMENVEEKLFLEFSSLLNQFSTCQ